MKVLMEQGSRELTFREKVLKLYERFAYVQKGGRNAHFKYTFMQESAMKRKFNLACRELGLVVVETTVTPVGVPTGKEAVVKLRLVIEDVHDLEEPGLILEGIGGGSDSGDKAPMKAVVSAYKYALANGLSVETGDDPEDDPATDEAAGKLLLIAEINESATLNSLEYLKPRVAAMKGTPDFDAVREAFKARKAALQQD